MMDRLLTNARVLTMDAAMPLAEAVAITGDRISAVGPAAQLLAQRGRDTEVIDLGGRTVVPGFVDAHNHFGPTTLEPVGVNLAEPFAADIPSIQQRIREAAAVTPRGGWIRAYGYSDLLLAEKRHPTRWELDEAAPEHPVVLVHTSYHRAAVNSRGLELAAIMPGRTYLPGGVIDCDTSGLPTGVVAESATNPFQKLSMDALMERHADTLLDLVEANARRHLALGITSVQDAWAPPAFIYLFRRAAAAGRLPLYLSPLRGASEGLFHSPAWCLDAASDSDGLPPHLRRGGMKLYADGAGPTCAVRLPYGANGDTRDEGLLFYHQSELDTLVERAHRLGFVVAIHAIGNRGIESGMAAIARARAAMPGGVARFRIDHFSMPTAAMIEEMKDIQAAIVSQPVGIRQFGDRRPLTPRPPEILQYPLEQARAAGVVVAGSSDAPCFDLPPLWGIGAAVDRRSTLGNPFAPEQALSAEEAIRMYTLNAASAGGSDDVEGSLTPGKLANLVVLSQDPRSVPSAAIRDILVDQTWVDGKREYAREGAE